MKGSNKKGKTPRIKEAENIQPEHGGRALVMVPSFDAMPPGRKLEKAYSDKFKRLHIQINGKFGQMNTGYSLFSH